MTQLWQVKEIESIFKTYRFDLQDFMKAADGYPKLLNTNEQAAQEFGGQPGQDAFFNLYKASPKFAEPCKPSLTSLKALFERANQTPEFQKLKEGSTGDALVSAFGAEMFVNQVLKSLPEEVKEAAKQQNRNQQKADEVRQQAEDQQENGDLLSMMAQMAQEQGDQAKAYDLQQQAEQAYQQALDAQQQAEKSQGKADKAGQNFEQALAENEAQVTAALNNAATQASEKASETQTLVRGFSLAAGGDGESVNPEDLRGIMKLMQNQPNLQELAKWLGWARQMVRAEWRKGPKGHTQMTGYRNQPLQPGKMASFEMARMVSPAPAIRQDWQRRAVDNAVSHRQYEGESQEGQGPMVLVTDISGSMSGPPRSLAIALEWALLDIARRDNRQFISIPFSGPGNFNVWHAPETGKPDLAGLLAHLSQGASGGTEPYAPMAKALEEIKAGNLKADIMLLTDDDFAQPPADFMKRLAEAKAERPLKVVTVVVGGKDRGHQAKQFSDKVVFVDDLLADREKLRTAVAEVV